MRCMPGRRDGAVKSEDQRCEECDSRNFEQ
jgi:hypothetical protein